MEFRGESLVWVRISYNAVFIITKNTKKGTKSYNVVKEVSAQTL